MHISYQPLWDHLEGTRHEERGLAACRRTYHQHERHMGKGEHISMKTLLRICGALHCDIADVIALEQDDNYVAP